MESASDDSSSDFKLQLIYSVYSKKVGSFEPSIIDPSILSPGDETVK
jgi:hypothetical protein